MSASSASNDSGMGEGSDVPPGPEPISRKALFCLVAQHASNAWSEAGLEFCAYLYLVTLFPRTLLPASILGLTITAATILFSASMGDLVDRLPRLALARSGIMAQKTCQGLVLGAFLLLFGPLRDACEGTWGAGGGAGEVDTGKQVAVYGVFLGAVGFAALGRLNTVLMDVSVDRDWILVIAEHSQNNLTCLNTALRRTTLLVRLLAPLLASAIATAFSYRTSVLVLIANSALSAVAENLWIAVIWSQFPVLEHDELLRSRRREERAAAAAREAAQAPAVVGGVWRRLGGAGGRAKAALVGSAKDWAEFVRMPVFMSCLAMSCLYLTTLSFDGIMLSWLKAERGFSDSFIALMRAVCVFAGLGGTFAFQLLERNLGLLRAGAWSLWFEVASLAPVVLVLFATSSGLNSSWNVFFFFGAVALSRIGLYSYDLVGLQVLQISLEHHPRRGRFTAMQASLSAMFDLAKFAIVLVLHRPDQFHWTALISFLSVLVGTLTFSAYLRKVRGHLLHWSYKGHGKDLGPNDPGPRSDPGRERARLLAEDEGR